MTSISRSIATGFLAVTFLIPALALAQATVAVPQTIGYQGRLLKTDGTPVTGTVTFTFGIYDAESGGTALWEEKRESVAVSNGLYAVFLGAKSPESAAKLASVFDGHDRWLQVQVNNDAPLSQRHKIGSVAYAITATNAQHAVNADRAATATQANTAGSADTATNVSGGTVNATSGVFTQSLTVAGIQHQFNQNSCTGVVMNAPDNTTGAIPPTMCPPGYYVAGVQGASSDRWHVYSLVCCQ